MGIFSNLRRRKSKRSPPSSPEGDGDETHAQLANSTVKAENTTPSSPTQADHENEDSRLEASVVVRCSKEASSNNNTDCLSRLTSQECDEKEEVHKHDKKKSKSRQNSKKDEASAAKVDDDAEEEISEQQAHKKSPKRRLSRKLSRRRTMDNLNKWWRQVKDIGKNLQEIGDQVERDSLNSRKGSTAV